MRSEAPAVKPSGSVRHIVWRRHYHMPHWLRLSRYLAGSLICFGVSEVVFISLFGVHALGARGSSVVASLAGVIPGYYLNRTWTWGRRGRSHFRKEVVPYWITVLISTAIAAVVTGWVNAAFLSEPRLTRTMINALGYMGIYGVIFVAKYVIFHKWLFAPPPKVEQAEPVAASA